MQPEDIQHFKKKLEAELTTLTNVLAERGRVIDTNGDWVASVPEVDTEEEDPTYQADRVEEFDTNVAAVTELEQRYVEVTAALDRIATDTYGICEVLEQPIERERLEANPAARTCIAATEGTKESA